METTLQIASIYRKVNGVGTENRVSRMKSCFMCSTGGSFRIRPSFKT